MTISCSLACLVSVWPRLDFSYGYDEGVTVSTFVDQGSILRSFTDQVVFNNHPLLSASNWVVWHLGGTTEPWQRVVPLGATLCCVGLASVGTRRRYGLIPSLVCGTLIAVNPLLVEQAAQARGYALATLFITAASLEFDDWLRGRSRLRWYAALVALALLSHLYVIIVVLAHGTGAWVRRRDSIREWETTARRGVLVAFVLYIPMVGTMLLAATTRPKRFIPAFPWDVVTEIGGNALGGVVLVGALVAAVAATKRREIWAMAGAASAALALVWLLARPHDLYPRFLVWLVPLSAVAVASLVRRAPWTVAALPLLLMVWVPMIASPGEGPGIRSTAAAYDSYATSERSVCTFGSFHEAVAVYLADPPARFETSGLCEALVVSIEDVSELPSIFEPVGRLPGASRYCVAARPAAADDYPASGPCD